jgi:uroporphyrinogen-III decarboxylase
MVTLTRLGIEVSRFAEFIRATSAELVELGYPDLILGGPYVPLDVIGDFLRDIKGILLDIYRYPDKVKQACSTLLKLVFKFVSSYKPSEPKLLFTPLHLNSYLSPKLYNEFYWPYLKEIIIEVNKQGMKPLVFFEGSHDAHLETILELPKGWGIAYFEQTDVRKAKNILAGHTCIMGGIPVSLLIGGTPNKIEEYIKKLMVEVKPGGGFIVATDTMLGLTSQTPIENIKAMLAAVEKYGKY